jgi:hypothetical protein
MPKREQEVIMFQKIKIKRGESPAKRDDWKRERKVLRQRKMRHQEYHMNTFGR